jgi:hypothetical protein
MIRITNLIKNNNKEKHSNNKVQPQYVFKDEFIKQKFNLWRIFSIDPRAYKLFISTKYSFKINRPIYRQISQLIHQTRCHIREFTQHSMVEAVDGN